MHVQVSDFGALILTIMFPDRNGEIKDITLGFDELKRLLQYRYLFWCLCGQKCKSNKKCLRNTG